MFDSCDPLSCLTEHQTGWSTMPMSRQDLTNQRALALLVVTKNSSWKKYYHSIWLLYVYFFLPSVLGRSGVEMMPIEMSTPNSLCDQCNSFVMSFCWHNWFIITGPVRWDRRSVWWDGEVVFAVRQSADAIRADLKQLTTRYEKLLMNVATQEVEQINAMSRITIAVFGHTSAPLKSLCLFVCNASELWTRKSTNW